MEKEIAKMQQNEKLNVGVIQPRFFLDIRSGCGAIRDRQHPNYNPRLSRVT